MTDHIINGPVHCYARHRIFDKSYVRGATLSDNEFRIKGTTKQPPIVFASTKKNAYSIRWRYSIQQCYPPACLIHLRNLPTDPVVITKTVQKS